LVNSFLILGFVKDNGLKIPGKESRRCSSCDTRYIQPIPFGAVHVTMGIRSELNAYSKTVTNRCAIVVAFSIAHLLGYLLGSCLPAL
jgi:hypothetical protein